MLNLAVRILIITFSLALKGVTAILRKFEALYAFAYRLMHSLEIISILCVMHVLGGKYNAICDNLHSINLVSVFVIIFQLLCYYFFIKRVLTLGVKNFVVSQFTSHIAAYRSKRKLDITLSLIIILISICMFHSFGIIEAIMSLSYLDHYYARAGYKKKILSLWNSLVRFKFK